MPEGLKKPSIGLMDNTRCIKTLKKIVTILILNNVDCLCAYRWYILSSYFDFVDRLINLYRNLYADPVLQLYAFAKHEKYVMHLMRQCHLLAFQYTFYNCNTVPAIFGPACGLA